MFSFISLMFAVSFLIFIFLILLVSLLSASSDRAYASCTLYVLIALILTKGVTHNWKSCEVSIKEDELVISSIFDIARLTKEWVNSEQDTPNNRNFTMCSKTFPVFYREMPFQWIFLTLILAFFSTSHSLRLILSYYFSLLPKLQISLNFLEKKVCRFWGRQKKRLRRISIHYCHQGWGTQCLFCLFVVRTVFLRVLRSLSQNTEMGSKINII